MTFTRIENHVRGQPDGRFSGCNIDCTLIVDSVVRRGYLVAITSCTVGMKLVVGMIKILESNSSTDSICWILMEVFQRNHGQ